MKFHFRLLPLGEIAPWGGETPCLHWFGLTLGWFWITVGDDELFRYTDEAMAFWARPEFAVAPALPYEDYQVARYFEDLMEMLPEILDAVPADIAARTLEAGAWAAWQNRANDWQERTDTDDAWDTYYAAVGWWDRRTWDAGHLAYPPTIHLWRVGETVTVRWDNRERLVGTGIPVWAAAMGEVTMPVADFIDAVNDFADGFLAAMAERVQSVQTHWSRPEIAIDTQELMRSQQAHALLPDAALNPWAWDVRRGVSWDEVRAAIAHIDSVGDQ